MFGGSAENPHPSPGGIEAGVIEALRTCFDPEIPVNIYELGLIYDLQIDDSAAVSVKMTLTSPACPVGCSAGISLHVARSSNERSNTYQDCPWVSREIRIAEHAFILLC